MGKLIGFLIFLSGFVVAAAAATAYWNILKTRKTDSVELGDELKKYCESWRINVEVNSISGFDVAPQECVGYIKKYMTSSQYKADSQRPLEDMSLST
ncbi:hypothetical protein ACFX2C_035625 [Malus domestica]